MIVPRRIAAALFALFAVPAAAAPFAPATLPVAGPRTQLMVLGTPHLSEMGEGFRPEQLAPLLDKLAAFRPDIVTIEALSGPECDMVIRYKPLYPDVAENYCWDTTPARSATGLDAPAAEVAVDTALRASPAQPTAAQRRHLAALFLAANDRSSAVIQWLRLPAAERKAADGIDAALLAVLDKQTGRANENVQIAAVLAARLGLERVYPVDDHTSDRSVADAGADYEKAIMRVWSAPNPFLETYKARKAAVSTPADMLGFYRYMNDPATNQGAIKGDMGAALMDGVAPYYGRHYVGWWEVRNLRMVANIRATFVSRPGVRVLSIVGATHKAYFDAYLGMMSGVDIVDAQAVLK